jgi:hypothetical protein
MTFMMRPSVSSPTGTVIGEPVSYTAWPRTRPSDVSMAMQRMVFSPRCCATSRTSRLPPFIVSSAFRIGGRSPSNCTSTTAPMTCDTRPAGPLAIIAVAPDFAAAGFAAAAFAGAALAAAAGTFTAAVLTGAAFFAAGAFAAGAAFGVAALAMMITSVSVPCFT